MSKCCRRKIRGKNTSFLRSLNEFLFTYFLAKIPDWFLDFVLIKKIWSLSFMNQFVWTLSQKIKVCVSDFIAKIPDCLCYYMQHYYVSRVSLFYHYWILLAQCMILSVIAQVLCLREDTYLKWFALHHRWRSENPSFLWWRQILLGDLLYHS